MTSVISKNASLNSFKYSERSKNGSSVISKKSRISFKNDSIEIRKQKLNVY